MRITKRIFSLLLTVALLVSVLCACNTPTTPDQTSNPDTTDATTPEETTPETTTTADPLTPPATPAQKITSVYITCGTSAIETFAAAELKWYFAKKNVTISEDGLKIELTIDDTRAKPNGYRITSDENGVVIAGGNERGLAYGLYGFLENVLGVHLYSPDTTTVDDGDVMIGGGVLDVFEPVFEVLNNPWHPIDGLPEKNGGNPQNIVTKTLSLNSIVGTGTVRPCLTDPKNLSKAIEVVKNYLRVVSDITTLSFSPATDYDQYCFCENCARVCEEEGSPAGLYIRFLNELTQNISADYPELKYEIVARAYLKTAPNVTKPADNISIRFNTEKCHISHPYTDTSCPVAVALAESIRSWGAIGAKLHIEYSLIATVDFIPVFANLGALRENMKFFAECGVDSLSFTGNIVCPTGEFGELRVYLLSKLLQNPTMSDEEYYGYMDAFLKAFYGEGWEYIRNFIDKTTELAADGKQTAKDGPLAAITEEEYLENEATFDEWWDKAEELAGDRIDFVKRARYQWRYVKLCLHPNAEDAQALITDAASNPRVGWRNAQWNVDTELSDLNLSPLEWVYKS